MVQIGQRNIELRRGERWLRWAALFTLWCGGCFGGSVQPATWDYGEVRDHLRALQKTTEEAPKQAIVMFARELAESLENHGRGAPREVGAVLLELSVQMSAFREAIASESKQELLKRLELMESSLPAEEGIQ